MPMEKLFTNFLRALVVVVHLGRVELVNIPSNFTDQLALLAFKSSINLDPTNVLSNWTKDTDFCAWAGVSCSGSRQRVKILVLQGTDLYGTITTHLGNLSFLQLLDLRSNNFRGHLPNEIGRLRRLKGLILQNNLLEGTIPAVLQDCKALQVLSLAINNFIGGIPEGLSTLPLLRILFLGQNNLTGSIPASFGNISRLEYLGIELNNIEGSIPVELAQLPNLIIINLQVNNLSGPIPPAIFNKSSMTSIGLNFNAFSGDLPTSTGLWLPNLQLLYLHFNQLTGNIPSYLSNCSKLSSLYLSNNSFTPGPIPTSFGNLKSLQNFDASICQVTGNIPEEFGSLKNLSLFGLAGNNLTGNLPPAIGGIENLQRLYLGSNNFNGSIPDEICLLTNLGEIYLSENNLSGSIPSCIGNLRRLQVMTIDTNKLSLIPSSLWNLQNLRILNLSYNSIGGCLDSGVTTVNALQIMDLSWNQISGSIPAIIGSFPSLASLNLSRNSFSGSIPDSFGKLITLDSLDLSHNNLSGSIPKFFEALTYLQYLNLSDNQLSGQIPSGGPFPNFTAQSFKGNQALCGAPILQVPPCTIQSLHKWRSKTILLQYIVPVVGLTIIIVAFVVYLVKRRRDGTIVHSQHSTDLLERPTISYMELCRATNDFCETNLVGVGSYGAVYKGVLSDGTTVAVKILNLHVEGAFRSFDAECQVLRTTRHRNLVKVITTCSNPELRALVLQFMPNQSLEKWLYSHNYFLNLLQRVSIVLDIALALEYLHCAHSEPVVHCDLKPSNILLDQDMVGHVADFGIAKILANDSTAILTNTLGTLGYIAPEYGSEGRVSTSGDIYSYGILLLETFTRKKPTDEMFLGEVTLRQWVSAALPNRVTEVVDSGLLITENGVDTAPDMTDNLLAILDLGLNCSNELPAERIDINEVVGRLNQIQRQLLGVRNG